MSVPGTGWGYDKDIAQSLADIAEHLAELVNISERKEARFEAASAPAEDVGMMLLAGSLILSTLDSDKLHLLEKHKRLREFAGELLQRAKEKDGKTIKVQAAIKEDSEKGKVES